MVKNKKYIYIVCTDFEMQMIKTVQCFQSICVMHSFNSNLMLVEFHFSSPAIHPLNIRTWRTMIYHPFFLPCRYLPQCGANVPGWNRPQESQRLPGPRSKHSYLSGGVHCAGAGSLRAAGKGTVLYESSEVGNPFTDLQWSGSGPGLGPVPELQ